VSQRPAEESLKGDEEAALFGPNRTGSMSSSKRGLLLTQNNLPRQVNRKQLSVQAQDEVPASLVKNKLIVWYTSLLEHLL
jgi:hypothetical protein